MVNWKYEYLVNQLHRTAYKKHENYVIGSLLHDESLSELKPCTQHYVRRSDNAGYALLDLYYPQIELAVEIDEPHHYKGTHLDKIRQQIVENDLMCEFIRIDVKEGNVISQTEALKERIKNKILEFKEKNKFNQWVEPKILDIFKAKQDFKKSLFIKIKGEIHPDNLMARQTGYWRIANDKRNKIEQVVVVHNSIVSRVFKNIQWHIWNEHPEKVGYSGSEANSDDLVGTIINNWNTQQTITYSVDVY